MSLLPCRVFSRIGSRANLRKCFYRNLHTTRRMLEAAAPDEAISVDSENVQRLLQSLRDEFYRLKTKTTGLQPEDFQRIKKLSEIVSTYEQRNCALQNMSSLGGMDNEKDPDMKELIKEEMEVYGNLLAKLNENLIEQLLSLDIGCAYPSLYFEISAGVGGQEAMLFASDLLEMYTSFFAFKGWDYEIVHCDNSEIGGIRHATVLIANTSAYPVLKLEGGVHRVQRVPATEKSGRIHTSTVTVAIIPRPDNVDAVINEKDLKIETKRASGAGGQHVNTTDSAVRIVHLPTGIVVECQTERSQVKNKEIALKKLQTKLIQDKLQAQEADKIATRKAQVGSSNRNEKIRTYNFIQDRITDHRVKGRTLHNLEGFLEGGVALDNLINQLVLADRRSNLMQIINSMSENRT